MHRRAPHQLKFSIFRLSRSRLIAHHIKVSSFGYGAAIRWAPRLHLTSAHPRPSKLQPKTRLPLRHAVLEIDPVARRNTEEVRSTPHDIVLELADLAVGVDQFPHHLDDTEPALLVYRAHDDAGEMIEIDGLAFDARRRCDQLICRTGIELEPALDQAVQFALLDLARLAIERDDMNQQRGCRQTIAGIIERPIRSALGATMSAMNWRSPSSIDLPARNRGNYRSNIWVGNLTIAIRAVG